MSKQKYILSFLSAVATFGIISFPALGQVNSNQGASQNAAINGDNNTIIQIINQTNRQQNDRGRINRRQAPDKKRYSNRNQGYRGQQNYRRDRGNRYGNYKKYRNHSGWGR